MVDADFSRDAKALATFDANRRLVIWDLATTPPVRRRLLELPEDVRPPIRFVAESGSVALFAGDSAVVTVKIDTGRLTREELGPDADPLLIGPDGREVATVTGTGSDKLFSVQHLATRQRTFARPHEQAFLVAFSPDGSHVVTTHTDGTVQVLDKSGETDWVHVPATYVMAAAFVPGARRLITGGDSGAVVGWQVGPSARHIDAVAEKICDPHRDPRGLALSRAGDRLAVACEKGVVELADLARISDVPRRVGLPDGHDAKALVFLDADRVLALLDDGRLAVLDVREPSTTASTVTLVEGVHAATTLSRNGPAVGALTRDGEILTWDEGQPVDAPMRFRLPPGEWVALAIGPNGREFAVGNSKGLLVHLDRQSTRSTTLVTGGAKFVSLSISPDGTSLAAVDERARAWIRGLDPAGGAMRAVEGVRGSWVDDEGPLVSSDAGLLARFVEYSPNGRYLALLSDDGLLLLDPSTLQRLSAPLSPDSGRTPPFSFDGTGSRLARVFRKSIHTGALGVEIEDLDWSSWIRAACRLANRELSDSEVQTYLGGAKPTTACADALRGTHRGS